MCFRHTPPASPNLTIRHSCFVKLARDQICQFFTGCLWANIYNFQLVGSMFHAQTSLNWTKSVYVGHILQFEHCSLAPIFHSSLTSSHIFCVTLCVTDAVVVVDGCPRNPRERRYRSKGHGGINTEHIEIT